MIKKVKVQVPVCLIKQHSIDEHGEVHLHTVLNLALEGRKWLAAGPGSAPEFAG